MKHQKYYNFLQQQILLMMGLSLVPGLVYVIFGWVLNVVLPPLIWYSLIILTSLFGWKLYTEFNTRKMDENDLRIWYKKLTWFMYVIFSSWSIIFVIYVSYDHHDLKDIAIFIQLGISLVASALLVSDKKLFVPVLLLLMLPLIFYFSFVGAWYGYVLSFVSLLLLAILLYASYNTNTLLHKNYFQAQHDVLTGLFNRRYFIEYMESLTERLIEVDKAVSIILIDLDRFKTINDSFGYAVGDKLLIAVSSRIQDYTEKSYMLARLGGDEFVLVAKVLEDVSASISPNIMDAEKLLFIIKEPYEIDGHHLHISASIGIHKLDPSSFHTTNFIKEVDMAMYDAKEKGRDTVVVFNKNFAKKVERYSQIEQKLHLALEEEKMLVYYQPQFDREKNLVGFESLIRWHDENLGNLSPSEFIPIAEKTGIILDIGYYVLKETFKSVNGWSEKGVKLKSFSVNVSMRQLLDETFVEDVNILLQKYFPKRESHQKIYFEITEHVFSEDIQKVISIINKLRKIGISFSIDDFGTGYSALSSLTILPIEQLKIDKSFIDNLSEGQIAEKLIMSIVSIARNFDLNIVAEGVETFEQFDFLDILDCDIYQGFYFEKALAKSTFEEKYIFT